MTAFAMVQSFSAVLGLKRTFPVLSTAADAPMHTIRRIGLQRFNTFTKPCWREVTPNTDNKAEQVSLRALENCWHSTVKNRRLKLFLNRLSFFLYSYKNLV